MIARRFSRLARRVAGSPLIRPRLRRRQRGDIRADINVTPLVDVVLVLLIIFMVVGPAIAQGVPVQVPRTLHHQSKPDDGKDLVVSIDGQGQVFLRNEPIALPDLPRRLEQERQRAPERKVHLKGDDSLDYRQVRAVMDAIRKTQVEEILLVTRQRRDGE